MSYFDIYVSAFHSEECRYAHLDDFLVGHSGEEYVLFVFVWMETHNVRHLAVAESFQTLPCLRIPQLHLTVMSA